MPNNRASSDTLSIKRNPILGTGKLLRDMLVSCYVLALTAVWRLLLGINNNGKKKKSWRQHCKSLSTAGKQADKERWGLGGFKLADYDLTRAVIDC